MGVRLSAMKAAVRETSMEYDDETIAFAYRPNEFTLNLADTVDAAASSGDLNAVAAILEPVIVWWDVLDENDERLPATAEVMRQFPLRFLVKVMGAVTEDQTPQGQQG